MLTTPCIGCGVAVPLGGVGYCERCRPLHRAYRHSSAWQRRRLEVRQGAACAMCGARDVPLEVHHTIALAADMAAALGAELEPLCRRCHQDQHRAHRR